MLLDPIHVGWVVWPKGAKCNKHSDFKNNRQPHTDLSCRVSLLWERSAKILRDLHEKLELVQVAKICQIMESNIRWVDDFRASSNTTSEWHANLPILKQIDACSLAHSATKQWDEWQEKQIQVDLDWFVPGLWFCRRSWPSLWSVVDNARLRFSSLRHQDLE